MMSDDCTRVRPNPLPYQTRPEKIHSRHRERLAIVYIRQSTPQQVERHQESTRLQYGVRSGKGTQRDIGFSGTHCGI
jgi:hypothetical protein